MSVFSDNSWAACIVLEVKLLISLDSNKFLEVSKQIVLRLRVEFMVPKEYTSQHMKERKAITGAKESN